jgi:hypothetical protein
MTPLTITLVAAIASLVLLGVVFELIRSRRLRERYALVWLVTALVLLVLALWRDGLNTLAGWMGIETYPPSVFFAALLFFVLVMLLHHSTVLSKLSDQNTLLAQKLALLEEELRALGEKAKSEA